MRNERQTVSLTRNKNWSFVPGSSRRPKRVVKIVALLVFAIIVVARSPPSKGFAQQQQSIQSAEPIDFHFIHTTNEASFHRRSVRAIESVFFHHPKAKVTVHVPKDAHVIGLDSDMTERPFQQLLDANYDIVVQSFTLKSLIEEALSFPGSIVSHESAQEWMDTKILANFMGSNWVIDIADLARLLILYTKGGVYLDTDVIVVRPLDDVPNAIGFERPGGPSNAVLKFNQGNAFIGACLNSFFENYISNTKRWGYVGPSLLRRVYFKFKFECMEITGMKSMRDELQKYPIECPVAPLWQEAFFPDVSNCFVETPQTETKKRQIQENSFVVHTYNQRVKEALATINITKMKTEDTLCNWLYSSFCIFCEDDVWAQ